MCVMTEKAGIQSGGLIRVFRCSWERSVSSGKAHLLMLT
jgi:hypothetical protein